MIMECNPFKILHREAGSTFPSIVPDVGIAHRAGVAVDLAVLHAERDEAAAQVAPAEEEAQAPEPGLGGAAAVALHLGLYRDALKGGPRVV